MIKTLLYATDLTEHAVMALRYAYNMSSKLGAKLIVLYAHQIPSIRVSVSRPPAHIEHRVIEEQKEILKAYCAKHVGNGFDHGNIELYVVHDDSVSHAIIEKSKEQSAEMVLIGRKDKHTKRGLFVGDIGKKLLKNLPCPLLIVPNSIGSDAVKNILYATDFEEADIFAINKMIPMAKAFDAKIHIVHILTEKEYAGKDQIEWLKELLAQKVAYKKMEFKLIFSDTIDNELEQYAKHITADILVLLEREKKGFLQKLFAKSLVKKMESHISIPLLSFNKRNL